MRLQIDYETRMIHILDNISVTDFNMIAFTHKLGDFTFAGLLTDEEGGEEIDLMEELDNELGTNTSVSDFYKEQDND